MSAPRSRPIAVVVVTCDSEAVAGGLLDTLEAGMAGTGWRLTVVDNGSSDRSAELARAAIKARGGLAGGEVIELDRNRGFASALNRGLAAADPESDLLALNPDVRLGRGAARRLQERLGSPAGDAPPEGLVVGLAAPVLRDQAGETLPSLRREPSAARALAETFLGARRAGRWGWGEAILDPNAYRRETVADWISGAALMVSRECLEACGPWDESFFLYSEDTEYALRARERGFVACLVPDAEAIHLGGASRTDPRLWRLLAVNKLALYRRRHGPVRALAFRAAALARELRLAASGNRASRGAARALAGGPPPR